jgi:hypothetical protein
MPREKGSISQLHIKHLGTQSLCSKSNASLFCKKAILMPFHIITPRLKHENGVGESLSGHDIPGGWGATRSRIRTPIRFMSPQSPERKEGQLPILLLNKPAPDGFVECPNAFMDVLTLPVRCQDLGFGQTQCRHCAAEFPLSGLASANILTEL